MSDPAEHERLAEVFSALADPLRLAILRLLPAANRCEELYNVCELADELGVAQPNVSHHLRILRQAGLVKCEKVCQSSYYRIDSAAVRDALAEFKREVMDGGGE